MMATEKAKPKTATFSMRNRFYRTRFHYFLIALMICMFLFLIEVGVILYQMANRPLPVFDAKSDKGSLMELTPFTTPNLLSDTVIRFAMNAATAGYTFDFANYESQISLARSYFTEAGWTSFLDATRPVINNVVSNQLFVSSVVSGAPVISNQGPLNTVLTEDSSTTPDIDYAWRIQIPFLVNYRTGNNTTVTRNFIVTLTLVRVSTSLNPQGIGVDQFVMVNV